MTHFDVTAGDLPLFRPKPVPPVQVDTRETSREAFASIAEKLSDMEQAVFDFIRGRRQGAMDDEIEDGTGLPHQTASARRNALMHKGLIRIATGDDGSPVKRKTRRGRSAFVWVAAAGQGNDDNVP